VKIVTRGKGIPKYSIKKGIMRVEFAPNKCEKIWIKMDTKSNEQYIIELDKFELAIVSAAGLEDKEVREKISRYPSARKFLK